MIVTVKHGHSFMDYGVTPPKLRSGGMRFECDVANLEPAHTRSLTFEENDEKVIHKPSDVSAFKRLVKQYEDEEASANERRLADYRQQQDLGYQNQALVSENQRLQRELEEALNGGGLAVATKKGK